MKRFAKLALQLSFIFLMSAFTLTFLLLAKLTNPDSLLMGYSQLLSLLPGKTGSYARIAFYRFILTRCATDIVIYFGTIFSQIDTEIDDGVYIGANCSIGRCHIKKNCLFGNGVNIMSGKRQHNFTDPSVRIQDQEGSYEKISIGEDTWIGNGALVMANVGNHCVIGAGAVVTEEVPDYAIMAGNPAKLVKSRAPLNVSSGEPAART